MATSGEWDPDRLLDIRPGQCVGIAKTKPGKPRCGHPIDQVDKQIAERILRDMRAVGLSDPLFFDLVDPMLRTLPGFTLCRRWHRDKEYHSQGEEVLESWRTWINDRWRLNQAHLAAYTASPPQPNQPEPQSSPTPTTQLNSNLASTNASNSLSSTRGLLGPPEVSSQNSPPAQPTSHSSFSDYSISEPLSPHSTPPTSANSDLSQLSPVVLFPSAWDIPSPWSMSPPSPLSLASEDTSAPISPILNSPLIHVDLVPMIHLTLPAPLNSPIIPDQLGSEVLAPPEEASSIDFIPALNTPVNTSRNNIDDQLNPPAIDPDHATSISPSSTQFTAPGSSIASLQALNSPSALSLSPQSHSITQLHQSMEHIQLRSTLAAGVWALGLQPFLQEWWLRMRR